MLTITFMVDIGVYIYTYMVWYNLSLVILIWTLSSTIVTEFNTLYHFSNFSFNSFYNFNITLVLMSMAGVPPFMGFLTKMYVLVLILNSMLFLMYAVLFLLLFLGLYFYLQNLSFLHSTNYSSLNYPFVFNERQSISYYYISSIFLFFTSLGVWYIDDLMLIIMWLFY